MKKNFLKAGLAGLLACMTLGLQCFAEESAPMVTVNGLMVDFDVPPIIEDGRTLIPVRAVSEMLEYDVNWDSEASRVDIINGEEKLELYIGKQDYLKNGEEKQMDVPAKITDGRTLVPLRLIAEEFGCTVNWLSEERIAEIIKMETVTVSNATELLNEIGSYKKIILKGGEYNLSQVEDRESNEKIAVSESFDGNEYMVFEASNLTIEGAEGETATIVVEPRYANVLTFMYCDNITVKNITAGHTIEPGSCTGGVLKFEDSSDVTVDNCRLYGCGTYGITTVNTRDVDVTNTEIYDCTYGLVEILASENVLFDNCTFRDSREFSLFSIAESKNIGVQNSVIKNNTAIEYCSVVGSYDSEKVYFKNCQFENNTYDTFATEDVYFENCSGIEK